MNPRQRRQGSTYRAATTLLLVAAGIGGAADLPAQGLWLEGNTYVLLSGSTCDEYSEPGKSSFNISCLGGGATAVATGYGASGKLGASVHVSASSGVNLNGSEAGAQVWAEWVDVLRWSGAVSPAVAVFELSITGSIYTDALGYATSHAGAQFRSTTVGTPGAGNVIQNWNWGPNSVVDILYSVAIDLSNLNLNVIQFSYNLHPHAGMVATTSGWFGEAYADFDHTAMLTGFRFEDEHGADITNTVNYTFDNGTQIYPPGTSVVPEPLSMVLLGTGLAGVFAFRRRR